MGDLGSIPGLGNPLEEGVATHSSILAWRIPWTSYQEAIVLIKIEVIKHIINMQINNWILVSVIKENKVN